MTLILPALTDEELAAQALAADPDRPLPDDAMPFVADPDAGACDPGLLPSWYMPAVTTVRHSRVRTVAALLVVSGLVVINALGLCITYGQLTAG